MAPSTLAKDEIERFVDLHVPQAPQVSPDGKRVVYVTTYMLEHKVNDNAVSSIWIADVGQKSSSRQLTSGLFKDQNPVWTADSDSIIFKSDRKEAGKKWGLYRLYLSGGEPILLTDPEHEKPVSSFAASPNGKFLAFLKPDELTPARKAKVEAKDDANVFGEDWAYGRLNLLHLNTRVVETIVKGDFHVADFVWSPDSCSIVYRVQPTPEPAISFVQGTDLWRVDVSTKQSSKIAAYKYDAASLGLQWVDGKIWSVVNVLPDACETSHAIASIPVSGGNWKLEIGGTTSCAQALSPHSNVVVALVWHDLMDELHDGSSDIIYKEFSSITAYHAVRSSKVSELAVLALVKSTINKPSEVYSVTSAHDEPVQLSEHGARYDKPVAVAIPIHVRSADNDVELDAVLYLPGSPSTSSEQQPRKPLPLFVEPHGGPYYRYTNSHRYAYGWKQLLLRQGYAVLHPNYRGGASHGQHFAGPYLAGKHDWADVLTVTAHVVSEGYADKDNIIIGGWSYGGSLSYISAVRNGTDPAGIRFRAAIPGAGTSDWDSMALTSDVPAVQAEITGGSPWRCGKGSVVGRTGSALWEFAAAAREGRIPPLLLLHGEADVRVPVTQAWGFQRACRDWGVPCQMVTYPREDHGFRERKHIVDLFNRVLQFCDQHFK